MSHRQVPKTPAPSPSRGPGTLSAIPSTWENWGIRIADWFGVAVILLLGAYGVFSLPYVFPATIPVHSDSYAAGFNNRVGVLATLVTIALLCLRNLFWRPLPPEPVESLVASGGEMVASGEREARTPHATPGLANLPSHGGCRPPSLPGNVARSFPRMSKSVLWLFIAIHAAAYYFLYWCLPHLDEYGDAIYFLGVAEQGLKYHLRPYIENDFAYGPGVYYLTLGLMAGAKQVGLTSDFGYTTSIVFLAALSLWVGFVLLDSLRVKTVYRVLIFSLFAICTFYMGMSPMCVVRYLGPYVVVLAAHQASARVKGLENARAVLLLCALCLLGGLATLAISADTGVVCVLALCIYCGYRAWFDGRRWLCPLLAALASLPIMLWAFPGCLDCLFAQGAGGNLIAIYPCPHVIFYLLTLFWLLPILLRPCAARRPAPGAPLLLGWSAIVVGTIPGALGRCDTMHVLQFGLGAYLLTMAVLARFHQRLLPAYAIFFFIWNGILVPFTVAAYYSNLGFLRPIELVFAGQHARSESSPSQLAEALGLKDFRAIMTPLDVDQATKEFLMDSGIYVPQRFPKNECVFSSREVALKLADISKADAVLVPDWVPAFKSASDEDIRKFREASIERDDSIRKMGLGLSFAWPVSFHTKYLPLSPEFEMAKYIAKNYRVVRHAANWVVMVREPAAK